MGLITPAVLDHFVEASFCSHGGYTGGGRRSFGSLSPVQVKKEGEGSMGRGRHWVGTCGDAAYIRWGVGTSGRWRRGSMGCEAYRAGRSIGFGGSLSPSFSVPRGGGGTRLTVFGRPLDRTSGQQAAH